jgi:hypothetical protein
MGQLLEGARVMLLRDLGRLDAGTLDSEIMSLARMVGWDLDAGAVVWDNGEEEE